MISAGDFRNGVTIEFEGNIYQIIEFQHVKPGKGAAFVRTKLKNIISGGVVEKTFRPTEKCPTAHIDRKDMQYLYADDDFYHFMDVETYDQIDLPKDEVGDALKFVKENEMCKVCSHKGNVFAVALTEQWDPRQGSSWNHFMMGQIDEWFFNSLVGISPDVKHGYQKFRIAPKPVGDLKYVQSSYETLYGKITVDWTRENGRFKLKLSVPVNTVAVVTLPGEKEPREVESGKHEFVVNEQQTINEP